MTDDDGFSNYLNIADDSFLAENIKIDTDGNKLSLDIVKLFERHYNTKLPRLYVRFISQHNGATIENNVFKYGDCRGSFCFKEFGNVISLIESIHYDNEHKYDTYPDLHVPFADDGGEGILFFDYSKDPNTDEPKIVIISEGDEKFIANSFEDFIKTLSVSRELLEDQLSQIETELDIQIPEEYKDFCIKYCTSDFNKVLNYSYYKLKFIFPGKVLWSICNWNENHFKNIIPFAADGNSLFCFDYTKIREGVMPVVLCNNKPNLDSQVIAGSFEEFVCMLQKQEDI